MRYACLSCGYIYDPDKGDPEGGIVPGTPGSELPPEWCCPKCEGSQDDFARWEEDD